MPFNQDIFFDSVRASLFNGHMTQQQVDGMKFKMKAYEERAPPGTDLRWISYCFATSYHETAATMWPIEEYGKGAGQPYGVPDANGNTFYGRGDVQLTWADNYKYASATLGLDGTKDDLYWHPEKALDPTISARVMMRGMYDGWFRKDSHGIRQTLPRYFSGNVDDAFGAREIINGDKTKVPSWSGGVNIGNLIKGYHGKFHTAFKASWTEPVPEPPTPEPEPEVPTVTIVTTGKVTVILNGEQIA